MVSGLWAESFQKWGWGWAWKMTRSERVKWDFKGDRILMRRSQDHGSGWARRTRLWVRSQGSVRPWLFCECWHKLRMTRVGVMGKTATGQWLRSMAASRLYLESMSFKGSMLNTERFGFIARDQWMYRGAFEKKFFFGRSVDASLQHALKKCTDKWADVSFRYVLSTSYEWRTSSLLLTGNTVWTKHGPHPHAVGRDRWQMNKYVRWE